jgi:hypothetical protein
MSAILGTLAPPITLADWRAETGLTQKAARAIVGGLSSPGKMPCHSYGLPAAECSVGSKLRAVSGSVCEDCYALKKKYTMYPEVIRAQYRRLASLADPQWCNAMVALVGWQERHSRVFRWHDSGDIQSVAHLAQIAEVCERLPWISFWIPTRETAKVRAYRDEFGPLPANLTVRESAALKGHFQGADRATGGRVFSAVALPGQKLPDHVTECVAPAQNGLCGDCRACWNPAVPVVAYKLH